MKKLILLFSLSMFTVSISFAGEAEYNTHLEKAREYESQKKFLSALGEYWDAMEANPSFDAREALFSYLTLSNVIASGKPGYGEFSDDFDVYDGWINIMKDYEKYWTEHFIGKVEIDIKQKSLNMSDRTATYACTSNVPALSEKYVSINEIILKGAKLAYKPSWTGVCDWPNHSVYNIEQENLAFKNDVPIIVNQTYENSFSFYERDGIGDNYCNDESAIEIKIPAFSISQILSNYRGKSLYCDLKFKIEDNEGNLIFDGILKSFVESYPEDEDVIEFNANSEQTKLLEAGKVNVKPLSVNLKYGEIKKSLLKGDELRKIEYKSPRLASDDIDAVQAICDAISNLIPHPEISLNPDREADYINLGVIHEYYRFISTKDLEEATDKEKSYLLDLKAEIIDLDFSNLDSHCIKNVHDELITPEQQKETWLSDIEFALWLYDVKESLQEQENKKSLQEKNTQDSSKKKGDLKKSINKARGLFNF